MQKTVISKSINETHAIASELITIPDQHIFFLHGDLGSGKTTFAQGIGNALHIDHHLQSPTFIIMRSYDLAKRKERSATRKWETLYHVDLYRVESVHEVEELGILDLMTDPKNLFLIEWPEKLTPFIPPRRVDVYFTYEDEDTRKIVVKENT